MSAYELTLPPKRPGRNLKNGRFLKGHVPANKGKKWDEFMSKRMQKRAAKGWQNLDRFRPKGHPNAGRKKICVVAIDKNGKFRVFSSIAHAASYYGGSASNIRRCCRENQEGRPLKRPNGKVNTDHRYKGVRFYYEKDGTWLKKYKE